MLLFRQLLETQGAPAIQPYDQGLLKTDAAFRRHAVYPRFHARYQPQFVPDNRLELPHKGGNQLSRFAGNLATGRFLNQSFVNLRRNVTV